MNEIAIASVPMQTWEQPWDPERALQEGTVFPSLYKPFYITESMSGPQAMPQSEQEAQLTRIQQISFALTDIQLYLHTHPEDKDACTELSHLKFVRKELLQKFATEHYPLTPDCKGCVTDGPIPWDNPDKKGELL